MLAYRSHPSITKAAFVREMQDHAAHDRIKSGHYWEGGTGCAVGCGIESIIALSGDRVFHSDHAALALHLGIPEWLASTQDAIFENLPKPRQQQFPVQFAEAIPDGADLSGLYRQFVPWMLREFALPVAQNDQARNVVERVALGIETKWQHDDRDAAGAAGGAAAYAAAGDAARASAGAEAYVKMANMLLHMLATSPIGKRAAS